MVSAWELEDVHSHLNDAFVIKVQISHAMVNWLLVDNGLGVYVLFKDAAERMGILDNINKGKTSFIPSTEPLSVLWEQ